MPALNKNQKHEQLKKQLEITLQLTEQEKEQLKQRQKVRDENPESVVNNIESMSPIRVIINLKSNLPMQGAIISKSIPPRHIVFLKRRCLQKNNLKRMIKRESKQVNEQVNNQPQEKQKFQLEKVYFFGRTFDEYIQMFNLNLLQMKHQRILDCAAGPASFAAEANWKGLDVVACDPMYDKDSEEVVRIAQNDIECAMHEAARCRDRFCRDNEQEDIEFTAQKLRALLHFAQDYQCESSRDRYVQAFLPNLPFQNDEFDMALCSYLLFFYSDIRDGGVMPNNKLDYDFHLHSVRELLRVVKKEVRIFPLVSPNSVQHPYLIRLLDDLSKMNVNCDIVPTEFKDVVNGNEMLVIRKK